MGITLEQAKKLEYGTVLYHIENRDSNGDPQQWRVAGAPRTWKTMPERVVVPLRYGLQKSTTHMSESELGLVCLKKWEATGEKIRFVRMPVGYNVLFGKTKVPYKNKYVDNVIGNVWIVRDENGKKLWRNNQEKYRYKTRIEASVALLNRMLD